MRLSILLSVAALLVSQQVFAAPGMVTQISDGQPQAPTATTEGLVTQISDHQPQAPVTTEAASPAPTTAGLVTQISDHQPQAPVTTEAPPATTSNLVTQISDHQPQAPATTAEAPAPAASSPSIVVFTSGASTNSFKAAFGAMIGLSVVAAMML